MASRRLVRSFKFKAGLKKDNLSVEQRMENAHQLKQQFSLGGFITVNKLLDTKWQIIREMLNENGWKNTSRSSLSFTKSKDVYFFRLQNYSIQCSTDSNKSIFIVEVLHIQCSINWKNVRKVQMSGLVFQAVGMLHK